MRIHEIILWNNHPTEGNRSNPHLDFPPGPFDTDLTNLGTASTKDGKVKRFWDLNRLERAAPPHAGTELIPSGTPEPTADTKSKMLSTSQGMFDSMTPPTSSELPALGIGNRAQSPRFRWALWSEREVSFAR